MKRELVISNRRSSKGLKDNLTEVFYLIPILKWSYSVDGGTPLPEDRFSIWSKGTHANGPPRLLICHQRAVHEMKIS